MKRVAKIFDMALKISSVFTLLAALHYKTLYHKVRKTYVGKPDKIRCYYDISTQWVINKQDGKSMESFFSKREIKKIAIYGMGSMEELLFNELKHSNVEISYFIDKNAKEYSYMYDVITMEELLDREKVDAIIITPVFDYIKISESLCKLVNCQIISLEEIVFSME